MIVIDSSSLAKVVLRERSWKKVPLGEGTGTLDFAYVEIGNAIWKATFQGRISEDDAKVKLFVLKNLLTNIEVFKSKDFLESALEIALRDSISVYDALFISLAKEKGGKLCTSDSRQHDVAVNYVDVIFIE